MSRFILLNRIAKPWFSWPLPLTDRRGCGWPEGLERSGWKRSELERRPRRAPEKVALAARLRRETTLTIRAIAGRWHLGSRKSATTRLHNLKRKDEEGATVALF